ncbi:unnamed protein product [Vitrella brassicaformis CCMP3155]|uniref:RRM Nup35-type domain-containing protein n=1 Tax=Vitrella brassicaformis (strain CCMP3155) TaxID=1169540 RepID=A0A0G4FN26_VITBC|nr:unnamed protein product [Vitrella brassicaformis CCMP3155]|mmetsp:Transcript_45089/g.127274  ORF Transcript_45089/g.127274 Transcript_45089/m.127274 type:complete len:276 (+) Transcript_45089:136-963(+)|eukprot:CEM15585.1 unnamed protein product [Vitrella brassicaformis CCMP3155]
MAEEDDIPRFWSHAPVTPPHSAPNLSPPYQPGTPAFGGSFAAVPQPTPGLGYPESAQRPFADPVTGRLTTSHTSSRSPFASGPAIPPSPPAHTHTPPLYVTPSVPPPVTPPTVNKAASASRGEGAAGGGGVGGGIGGTEDCWVTVYGVFPAGWALVRSSLEQVCGTIEVTEMPAGDCNYVWIKFRNPRLAEQCCQFNGQLVARGTFVGVLKGRQDGNYFGSPSRFASKAPAVQTNLSNGVLGAASISASDALAKPPAPKKVTGFLPWLLDYLFDV